MDKHGLTGAQLRSVDQRLPSSHGHNRHRCRLHKRKRFWLGRRFAFRHQRVLRVTAAIVQADVREHRIARFELRDLTSNFFNNACDIAAENYWERAISLLSEHSRSDQAIDRIYTGRNDTDEQLIVFRFWTRDVLILQNFWAAVLVNDNSFHRGRGR